MNDASAADRIEFFLLGAAIGAAVALLIAPESGARTRRRIRRKGENAAEYFISASKDLVERCEELSSSSGELLGDAAHELSERYRELSERSKQLLDEAAATFRRAAADRSR
jgi:gas vesicle protein